MPWMLVFVLLFLFVPTLYGYASFQGLQPGQRRRIGISKSKVSSRFIDHAVDAISSQRGLYLTVKHDPYDFDGCILRRNFVTTASKRIAVPCAYLSLCPGAASASSSAPNDAILVSSSLQCLQDLPPFDPQTTVRLYLCRHGETENNRLNIIQGARMDPPINEKGIQQATLLGLTLSHANPFPSLVLHSPLLRAKETAQRVTEQLRSSKNGQNHPITTRVLNELAELDFGSMAEGAPVSQYRSEMISLYTAWAFGNLDARMPSGGESGSEILTRIRSALNSMIEIAAVETRSSCLAAISHSSYLRLLIGAVDDSTVFSASLPQSNCGINVIDFPHPGSKSTTYDHKLVPSGKVIRVNEKRHLSSIPSDQASSIRTLVQSL